MSHFLWRKSSGRYEFGSVTDIVLLLPVLLLFSFHLVGRRVLSTLSCDQREQATQVLFFGFVASKFKHIWVTVACCKDSFKIKGTAMEHIWMKDCEIDRSIESEISAQALLLRSVVSFSQFLRVF